MTVRADASRAIIDHADNLRPPRSPSTEDYPLKVRRSRAPRRGRLIELRAKKQNGAV